MANDCVYIYDAAAGEYMTIGRAVIPRITYVGPFSSDEKAVQYLMQMNNYDRGQPIPPGFGIINVRTPLPLDTKAERPPIFSWLKSISPITQDWALRYEQKQKKTLKRKAK